MIVRRLLSTDGLGRRFLNNEPCPRFDSWLSQPEVDGGDSGQLMTLFLRRTLICSQAFVHPLPLTAANASRPTVPGTNDD